ncbi:MAG: hypothetical protein E7365_05280 [Clostridiales bacterium]|nr:hypothetical protein [Clostridiales bacterium]
MDRIEQTIRRNDEEKQKKDKFKYNFLFILAAALSLFAIYSVTTVFFVLGSQQNSLTVFDVLPLIVSVLGTVFCFLYKDEMLLEYDYIIEDDTLIIAKIKNLKSRKEVINLPVNALKRIEKYNTAKLNQGLKTVNCSLNEDEKKYMLYYEKGEKGIIVFEPNDAFLKLLNKELNK